MNEHNLSGMCAYINDFIEWYLKAESPLDVMIFVGDRFSSCSKDKKQDLGEIFDKLSTKISKDGKLNSDIYDIADNLLRIL